MKRFAVYADKVLVGYSMLEYGDPSMGVAHGAFLPVEAYAQIRKECVENPADQTHLHLEVRREAGDAIPCVSVGILDLDDTAWSDSSYAELNVLGIPYPLYGELFPHHVLRYEEQFNS